MRSRSRWVLLSLCGFLLHPRLAAAQNATVEVPQLVLNQLVAEMGVQSASGVYHPPGPAPASSAVPWQWWVTDARFTLGPEAMTFTASVRAQVNTQVTSETRTVPASVAFDPSTSRLRITVGTFKVPVQSAGVVLTQIDVAKLYGFAVPVAPQIFTLPLPGGGTRTVTAHVTGVTTQVQPGKLVLNVDVGF